MSDQKTMSLTLTVAEVVYIGNVLGSRPYTEVVALLAKLQSQVNSAQVIDATPK